jgi:hypothetical protein
MASRTIENERDRRMTIMTTCFIPCGAKMPIIALIAGALFGGSGLIATSAYFIGVAAIVISGIMLKKTKMFAGDPAPFVMELPAYHVPSVKNVLRGTWERGWSFIKRAGTVILISAIVLWFLQGYGIVNGKFGNVDALYEDDPDAAEALPEEEEDPELRREARLRKFRIAAGIGDLGAVLTGAAVILVLVAFLISMLRFVSSDFARTFSLWKTQLPWQ